MSAQWIIKGLDPVGVEKHGFYSHTFSHRHRYTQIHAHGRTVQRVTNTPALIHINIKTHAHTYAYYTTTHRNRHGDINVKP